MHGSSLISLQWPSWVLSSWTIAIITRGLFLVFFLMSPMEVLSSRLYFVPYQARQSWCFNKYLIVVIIALLCLVMSSHEIYTPCGEWWRCKQLEARSKAFWVSGFIFKLDVIHLKHFPVSSYKKKTWCFWSSITCEWLAEPGAINVTHGPDTQCLLLVQ